MVCAYRARASRWPTPLFDDPWAAQIAGSEGEEIAQQLDARWPPMETWLALRVAYLDRLVGIAVDSLSIRQIVILGAGYDTRAARLPRAGVQYFEVDHPATQAAKREVVAKLQTEIARILVLPEVKARLAADGADAVGNRPDEFAAYIRTEIAKWSKVVKTGGIKLE